MGQRIGDDKIAVASHSAGTISLPASLLTLGGRQYRTSVLTRLITTDVTLAANTLYFVYVQLVLGVPALRVSLSPPSAYKISNPTAILVSAFYSNGLANALGSFVNIEGVPISDVWDGGLSGIVNSGGAITLGTLLTNKSTLMRVGNKIEYAFTHYKTGTDGSAPAGTWLARPNTFTVDANKMVLVGGENFRARNSGHLSTSGDGRIGVFNYTGGNDFAFQFANGATNSLATTATHPYAGTQWFFSGLITFPANGLTNTSLKDL